ncbi:hypothetical protein [Mycolicibacterium fallax]|nr:hypothetical protein [Mycolicibacterium fallax]
MAAAKAGWDKLATGTSLLNVNQIPVVQGEFADAINDLLAQARTYLSGFSTAATEMSAAASESTDEESKLASAPTESQIEIQKAEIKRDSDAGRDYKDKVKDLNADIAERKRAVEELDEAAGQSQSQQECVGVPEVPGAGEGGDVENPRSDDEKERKEKDEAGEGGDEWGGGEGDPVDPSTDRKLPLVVPKETAPPVSSDAVGTGLSSDIAPTPAATPTPTAQFSPSSYGTPQMPQVQQPMMAASASPTPTSSAPTNASRNPMQGVRVDDIRKKLRDAERKNEDADFKKRDEDGEVTGAAVMAVDRGTSVDGVKTAAATTGAGVNAPTNVSSSNTNPANNPGQNPNNQNNQRMMGGGMMGAPPMGSGRHTAQKNNDLRDSILASDPPDGLMDSLDRSVDVGLVGRHSADNPSKKLADA